MFCSFLFNSFPITNCGPFLSLTGTSPDWLLPLNLLTCHWNFLLLCRLAASSGSSAILMHSPLPLHSFCFHMIYHSDDSCSSPSSPVLSIKHKVPSNEVRNSAPLKTIVHNVVGMHFYVDFHFLFLIEVPKFPLIFASFLRWSNTDTRRINQHRRSGFCHRAPSVGAR